MIMERLDSNFSSQAISARTLSQDKGLSGSSPLLIGLWVTGTGFIPVIF